MSVQHVARALMNGEDVALQVLIWFPSLRIDLVVSHTSAHVIWPHQSGYIEIYIAYLYVLSTRARTTFKPQAYQPLLSTFMWQAVPYDQLELSARLYLAEGGNVLGSGQLFAPAASNRNAVSLPEHFHVKCMASKQLHN